MKTTEYKKTGLTQESFTITMSFGMLQQRLKHFRDTCNKTLQTSLAGKGITWQVLATEYERITGEKVINARHKAGQANLNKTQQAVFADIKNGTKTTFTSRYGKRTQDALNKLVDMNLVKCVKTHAEEYPTKIKNRQGCTMEVVNIYVFKAVA